MVVKRCGSSTVYRKQMREVEVDVLEMFMYPVWMSESPEKLGRKGEKGEDGVGGKEFK